MSALLWEPSEERIQKTNMYRFMCAVNETFKKDFRNYNDLWEWSVNNLPDFWGFLWKFLDIKSFALFDSVIDDPSKMPGAKWFSGAKLNFAENLLRYGDDETAIIHMAEGKSSGSITYKELYNETAKTAESLRAMGVTAGDRVVGYMPNCPETIISMLAATSIGAVWSSCSPDFGIKGVLDRFGQIKPKVLITTDGYFFKGKTFDSLSKVKEILKKIPSVEKVIVVPFTSDSPDLEGIDNGVPFKEFQSKKENLKIDFEQLPFDHPLYIMYSSGTTGLPKCMVQSAGGILLHQMKEQVLHTDMKREDNLFYYTTCGWMMWNWMVSALSTGATITLFDGNPFHPDAGALWKMAEKEKVTVFGTSAGYIAALQASGHVPKNEYDLSSLRALLSTGSPLSYEGFEFVYESIKSDLQLASISGGTDLNGCFALGNPMGPVYSGELQCRGLGMDVDALDEYGRSVIGEQG